MNKFLLLILALFFFQLSAFAFEDFMVDTIDKTKVQEPYVNLEYDYSSTVKIPIPLQITQKISTRDKILFEGQQVQFKVKQNIFYKGKLIAREGELVNAKLKLITPSGMNGIQYSLIISDFEFKNLDKDKLSFEYQKDGWNRTYMVLPLKWALTILPPTGTLTNLIKGGHSKITPRTKVFVYYTPEQK